MIHITIIMFTNTAVSTAVYGALTGLFVERIVTFKNKRQTMTDEILNNGFTEIQAKHLESFDTLPMRSFQRLPEAINVTISKKYRQRIITKQQPMFHFHGKVPRPQDMLTITETVRDQCHDQQLYSNCALLASLNKTLSFVEGSSKPEETITKDNAGHEFVTKLFPTINGPLIIKSKKNAYIGSDTASMVDAVIEDDAFSRARLAVELFTLGLLTAVYHSYNSGA
jgi:hypothetical protein